MKNFDVKLNSKKVYDFNEANHAVKIKHLLQYSPVYAESTATNECFYLNTNGMQKNGLQKPTKTNRITIKGFNFLCKALFGTSSTVNTEIPQGHPTSIFGKYLFGRRFEIWNLWNICCKISCLLTSPRIFEPLKNGIIAYF